MTLEHRCARRYALSLPVRLRSVALGELRGVARDLSTGGMFVAVAADTFAPCSVVEVDLPLPATHRERKLRCSAIVVHRQENGVGLMFDELLSAGLVAQLVAPRPAARILAESAAPAMRPLRA